jgi:DNA-binding MarR family transcriptional regulator
MEPGHMPLKTLQIAILGGNDEAVFVGLRNFPAHKLVLITPPEATSQCATVSAKLAETLRLVVSIVEVKDSSIQVILDTVGQLVGKEGADFEEFLINVGSAGRTLACAGVTAAFVYGIKAFDVIAEQPQMFPVMKFSYIEAVTAPKIEILRAIERSGGHVESLEALSGIIDYGKPLLSYHIRGSQESKGLESLGLVEIERGRRGRLQVKLTSLGRTVLSTAPS